jgi:hypothetical protein
MAIPMLKTCSVVSVAATPLPRCGMLIYPQSGGKFARVLSASTNIDNAAWLLSAVLQNLQNSRATFWPLVFVLNSVPRRRLANWFSAFCDLVLSSHPTPTFFLPSRSLLPTS